MKKIIISLAILTSLICAACGSQNSTKTTSLNAENKPTTAENKPTTTSAGSPSSVVKDIYDNAMKRNCAAIPPMLTEDFKKAVGTSKDALDALCDTFTDSGKLTSVEVKSEEVKGDAATVKVSQTFKDGKKEEKFENLKKSDGKWLMDS